MLEILIPHPAAERRGRAHRRDDGATWSLCGMRTAAIYDVAPDTEETLQLLRANHRAMCGLCNDILRRRASKAERKAREAKAKQDKPPRITKAQRDQTKLDKWHAAAHGWEKKP